jgi:hypothetical protein
MFTVATMKNDFPPHKTVRAAEICVEVMLELFGGAMKRKNQNCFPTVSPTRVIRTRWRVFSLDVH